MMVIVNQNGIRARVFNRKGVKSGQVYDRGDVVDFSGKSRRRLMWVLRAVDWSVLCEPEPKSKVGRGFFLTLTYRDIPDGAKAKADLNRFLVGLRRRFLGCGGIWKMESQERRARVAGDGAFYTHFHLMLDCKERVDWESVRSWVVHAWSLGRVDIWTAYGGKDGRLMSYLGKYLGKDSVGAGAGFGRYWGRFGDLPIASAVVRRMGMAELLRVCEKLAGKSQFIRDARSRGCSGLSLDGAIYEGALSRLGSKVDGKSVRGSFDGDGEGLTTLLLTQGDLGL